MTWFILLLMLSTAINVSSGSDNAAGCSKYDFETRVLEKWLVLTHDLDKVKKRMSESERALKSEVATAFNAIGRLQEGFEELKIKQNHTENAPCLDGWVVFQGACYLFLNRPSTFKQAQEICVQRSAHLVHIDGYEENTFLRSYVSELKPASHWIGMSDEAVEGTWRWMDTEETLTYSDWAPRQPNQGRQCNCGAMWSAYGFQWVDEPCDYKYRPICKRRFQ